MQLRTTMSWAGVPFGLLASTLGLLVWENIALAKPEGPRAFCMVYGDKPECMGSVPQCSLCHDSTFPATWNSYGLAIKGALGQGVFEQTLPADCPVLLRG